MFSSPVYPTQPVAGHHPDVLQPNTVHPDAVQQVLTRHLGVVAIGRNEGDRLIRCLQSLQAFLPKTVPVIYVDSGSTDNSLNEAAHRGIEVVSLDMSIPFTGARARNAGLAALMQSAPETEYVQFIDGDCELLSGWMEAAVKTLLESPDVAVVFGRLCERSPNASIYNKLADQEWRVSTGEVKACGGIALMRSQAFQSVNGYNPRLICGEEPELCLRLRRLNWKIHCIDVPMATHDMDMHHFSQWWKRSIRSGWAIAQGAAMYGTAPEKFKRKEHKSGWFWGAVLPIIAILLAIPTKGVSLAFLLALYSLQIFKIYRARQRSHSPKNAFLYALFCVISKIPQAIGQAKYWNNRWRRQPIQLIEYKRRTS